MRSLLVSITSSLLPHWWTLFRICVANHKPSLLLMLRMFSCLCKSNVLFVPCRICLTVAIWKFTDICYFVFALCAVWRRFRVLLTFKYYFNFRAFEYFRDGEYMVAWICTCSLFLFFSYLSLIGSLFVFNLFIKFFDYKVICYFLQPLFSGMMMTALTSLWYLHCLGTICSIYRFSLRISLFLFDWMI